MELREAVLAADLVIGAVLIPGAKAPKLVTNEMVSQMRPGAVLVDIAIDQGGCFEDSRPTTHADPTFKVHDTVFYCVANMPGAVPRTSTYALTNATLPYAKLIADEGFDCSIPDPAGTASGPQHPGGQNRFGTGATGALRLMPRQSHAGPAVSCRARVAAAHRSRCAPPSLF